MKKIFLSLILLLITFASLSFVDLKTDAAEGSYYINADTSSGQKLINSLSTIISTGYNSVGYDGLKNAYKSTDVKPGTNYIWDMYSNYNYVAGSAFAGSYKVEGDGYNREHSVPQSWFNEAAPMKSDLFHVYPTDAKVNGIRSNYMFGETNNPTTVTGNGSKLGPSSHKLYSGTVFEPIDEYKGDFARTYFYMATRYKDKVGSWGNNFKGSYPYLTDYSVDLFMSWHLQDPVSQKEIDRNDAVYALQKNRNPYIDHPEYANFIWGDGTLDNPSGGNSGSETPTPETPTTPEVPETNVTGTTATLIKNVSDLKAGDKIIIASSNTDYALGTTQNNNNRKAVSITKTGDKLSFDSNVQVITLENGTKANTFAFNVGGYLYAASSGSNHLKTETTLSANSSWNISINSSGVAVAVAQGTYTRNSLMYNPNNGNPIFSCYVLNKEGMSAISIYKVDTVETNYNKEVNQLFNKYYDNGIYVKDTIINLTDAAKDDLINYFHASVNILERTTYYSNDELWMSRGDGKYSYYGTNSSGLTNATAITPYETPSNLKVVITGTTMLDYYTTLEKIKTNDAVWKKEGNVYYTTDPVVLKYYLDFTAPCLLEDIFNSNYFIYEKATLEEVNNTLVLKLVINSEMHNAVTSSENVLSQATIRQSDLLKINSAKNELANLDNVSINKDYTLPTNINGVSISWTGENVNGNIVTYIEPDSNFTNALTATLTIGDLEETVTINLIQLKYEEVSSGYEYTDFTQEEKDLYNEYFEFVMPFIPNNDYIVDEFDPTEDGVNGVYFVTLGNTQEEFNSYKTSVTNLGFEFDGTEIGAEGDTWYLYSKDDLYLDITYYEYEDEFYIEVHLYKESSTGDGGETPEIPTTSQIQAILDEAADLSDQEKLSGERTATGTVKEITEPYKSQYKNISFILTDGVAEILVHRAYGDCAATLKVGDTVTVTGNIINYKGTIEFQYPQLYIPTSGGNEGGNSEYLYTDFTASEKSLFNSYFGFVIPFMENNEYYLEEYTLDGEEGLNFYLYGASQSEFNAYLAKFNSGYTNDGTDVDEYGDTWYFYSKGEYYVDLSYYNTEEGYVVDVYVYYQESSNTGGNSGADYSDVITNDGKGLPNESDGVYDVDFTKADIKNVTELGYYIDGCPTEGNVKVLVIPVEFSDRTAASLGYSLDKLNKAFNGSGNDTDYRSVSEFYFESSYGKLDLEFVVLDEWFRPSHNSTYYASQEMDYYGSQVFIGDQLIMDEALAYLESRMDLSEFDSDGNSIIDAVVMINTLEIDDSTDFNWAYRYWNIYTDSEDYYFEYDGVSANDYLWASYQFLYEDENQNFNDTTAMNTYTFIHEFGHVLGANDYYDYTGKNSPLDGRDMMDYIIGDHNPYTKFNYGWLTTSRLVVASDKVTLTLNEFTSTGDSIIIANNWDDTLGAFQEYYVLMYYKHTGLNSDGNYFDQEGVVMYHVNASLYLETEDGEPYYIVYNSNTDASDEYGTYDNLIELCKSSTNSYVHVAGSSSSSSLVDDLGNKISYIFSVDSLTDTSATLTFTKNN